METAAETAEQTTGGADEQHPRVGPYDLLRETGRGGMSVVYEATDRRNGRVVALKVLTPELRLDPGERDELLTRVQREANIVSLLRHPNIVNVLDAGREEGPTPAHPPLHYLVMEFLNGETLAQRVERVGPMPAEEVADVLEQVAGALDALHGVGIIHRDVKPGNIMLLPDGTAKLMDFGIARHHDDTMTTRAGGVIGSPAYMSPEQALGRPATTLSDLWSLAAVVYTLLAARPPFQGDNIPSVLYQIIHEPPLPIAGLSRRTQAVLDRAFAADPPRRFLTAEAFARAFREAVEAGEPEAETIAVAPPPAPAAAAPPLATAAMPVYSPAPPGDHADDEGRRRAAIIFGTAGLAAVAALTALLASGGRRTGPAATPPAAPTAAPQQRLPQAQAPPPAAEAEPGAAEAPAADPAPPGPAAPRPAPTAEAPAPLPKPTPTPAPSRVVVTEKPRRQPPTPAARPTPPRPTPRPTPVPRRKPAPIVITIPPLEERGREGGSAPLTGAGEVMGMRGVWRGSHGGQTAELRITEENAEADRFSGRMTVRTPSGPVVLEVRGRLTDETGEPVITLEERRVVREPEPRSWDLGKNEGKLLGAGWMSGRGKDRQGRDYTWYFRR